MAFKISKEQGKQIDQCVEEIQEHRAEVEDAVREFNERVEEAYAALAEIVVPYAGKVADAKSVLEEIRDGHESDFDEKSEKWQEGENGSAVREWIEGMTEVIDAIPEVEFDENDPPQIDEDTILGEEDPAEVIENLTREP